MALPTRLKAGRLWLRPPETQDGPAVIAGLNDVATSRWLGRVPHPYGAGDFAAWLARAAAGGRWVITEEGAVLGALTLETELGYWLRPEARGRGLARAACAAVLAAHFTDPAAGDVVAGYFEGNAASAKVLAGLGFREVARDRRPSASLGVELPHVTLRLSRADWAGAHPLQIETARLWLAPLEPERDAADLARIGGQPEVARQMFSLRAPWPEAELRDWITASSWRGCLGFRLGIWRAGGLIGMVGIGGRPCTVSYFIDPAEAGQGYASEAMRAFLAVCLERFAVPELVADHFADNPASGAVLRKLGFRQTGSRMGESGGRLGLHLMVEYRLDRDLFLGQHGGEGEVP